MSAAFRPRLVNGRFGDPALYVTLAHEREALLFDLGDLAPLSARDLLRVRTVGISHMHIDHLIDIDALLRVNVGREAHIRLVGPEGLADRLGHKLQGYSWDLVERYETELCFDVGELHENGRVRWWRFRMARRFEPEFLREEATRDGLLIETQRWALRAAIVEHHGPCLAFALEEPVRINVWRSILEERSLSPGPWLNQLKEAIRNGRSDDAPIAMPDGSSRPLGELREIVSTGAGMKLGYATDLRDTRANRAVLQALMRDCDVAYIEASFAAEDAQRAHDRAHLTTTAAGEIARASGAKRIEPFHFSPRHEDEGDRLMAEVAEAFAGMA
jgi:ribonuclease Z